MPLLNRIRNNLVEMGLQPERLYARDGALQEARRPRRVHPAGPAVPGAPGARGDGRRPASTRTTCSPTDGLTLSRALPAGPASVRSRPGSRSSRYEPVSTAREEGDERGMTGAARSTRRWSSAPGSPASAPRSSCARPASRTSSSWSAPTASAAPGGTPPTPARPATSPRCSTRSRSRRTRAGRGPTRRAREICAHIEEIVERFDLQDRSGSTPRSPALAFDEARRALGRSPPAGRRYYARDGRRRLAVRCRTPACPDIRGLETFEGTKIHSARWDHDFDFAGKSVAVIGTGASAVQIIPELVKVAGSVKVFQRTPGWVLPRVDLPRPRRLARQRLRADADRPAGGAHGAVRRATRRPLPAWSGTPRSPP